MKVYELLVVDAEDGRDFTYHSERLFFTSPLTAEAYYQSHFQSPNLFWKVKEYELDSDVDSKTVAGNWTRDNLARYYHEKASPVRGLAPSHGPPLNH